MLGASATSRGPACWVLARCARHSPASQLAPVVDAWCEARTSNAPGVDLRWRPIRRARLVQHLEHRLAFEVCQVVDTVLVDQEAVYVARQSNDRLLLGASMSTNWSCWANARWKREARRPSAVNLSLA